MIHSFLTALIYELVQFLVKHKDFFEADGSAREKLLEDLKVPVAFKRYLAQSSAGVFMKDLHLVLSFLNGTTLAQLPIKGNAFFGALVEFFNGSLSGKMDQLPPHFYLLSYEERTLAIKKVIENDHRLSLALRDLLVNNSYQELAELFQSLAQAVFEAELVLVQTPREVEGDLRQEIRTVLLKQYPHSFSIFQVNRGLIGGFRVFVDGKTVDHSWFARISKITSLKSVS